MFIALNSMTATLLGALLFSEAFLLALAGVVTGLLIANWQTAMNTETPE